MKKETGRMSPPGLERREKAHALLGDESEYRRELLMAMMAKFTHQLGKKFLVRTFIHGLAVE
jgi:hypothetical protein